MGRRKLIEDDQLLARVRDVLVRRGTSVSSRGIAAELGISSSVLFQRFGSKEELIFAAMTPPAPDIASLLRGGARAADGRVHLERVLERLLAYFRTLVPVLLPLATHPAFSYEDFRRRHPSAPVEKLTTELVAAFEEKKRDGKFDCSDVNVLVLNLVAVAHSLAFFERVGVHDGSFSRSTVRALAGLVWRGVAPGDLRSAHGSDREE